MTDPHATPDRAAVERAAAHANGDLSKRGYGLPQSEAIQFLRLALAHLRIPERM
jgi:hypothetical protein